MAPARIDPAMIARFLPRGGRVLVAGASGESRLLADAIRDAGDGLGGLIFTGIFVPGLNRYDYLANPDCRVETFFMTPELKRGGQAVSFLPLCYGDILHRLRKVEIAAAIMMVAPPDDNGWCNFGPCVDFLAELWPRIPVRIAHINPLLPRTHGHSGIPFAELTAFVEAAEALPGETDMSDDPVTGEIARHVAAYVDDGATLQTGLGKVPGAVLRALTGRRNLRFHSGLIGEAIVDLAEAGALAPGASVIAGVAIGSERLYRAIASPIFSFQPVSITHDRDRIAATPGFVAVNSALEVDLFGQAYAELGPRGLMSGPGGASDYARAARASGSVRIVALAATAAGGTIGRIVLPGAGAGPVSLGRMDIDVVATEFGVADLRGLRHDARAAALIAVAAPRFREALDSGWHDYTRRF